MDPPEIRYIHNNSLLVVNHSGQMRQLFTPFRVQVKTSTTRFRENSWLMVEEVQEHKDYLIIYRIGEHWWPHSVFKLMAEF